MGSPFLPNWQYDITMVKNTPAFAFNPQETGGQYHEFRETGGAMWQAKNAILNGSTGTLKNITLPAWAIVFSSTGVLQLYSAPANVSPITWTLVGSYSTSTPVQAGVFNVLTYGAV